MGPALLLLLAALLGGCGRIDFESLGFAQAGRGDASRFVDAAFRDGSPGGDARSDDADTERPNIDGLLLHLRMETLTGSAADSGPFGLDVRCYLPDRCPSSAEGVIGSAAEFEPSTYDCVRLTPNAEFANGSFTVAGFVYLDVLRDSGVTVFSRPWGEEYLNSWQLSVNNDGTLEFYTQDYETRFNGLEGPTVDAGRWLHLAISFDGRRRRIYLDGVEVAEDEGSTRFDAHDIFLGCDEEYDQYPGGHLDGRIDDFRVYSRALSANEVAQLASQ